MKDRDNRHHPFPTNADVERAWQTFQQRVQHEKVPEVWLRIASPQAQEQETDNQSIIEEEEKMNQANQASLSIENNGFPRQRKAGIWKQARGWAAGAAAAVLVGGILSTSWGDKALAAMLQTFRVQHMQGVQVTDNDLRQLEQALRQGSPDGQTFDLERFGKLRQEGGGAVKTMTADEAEKALGFPLRAIGGEKPQTVKIQPELTVTLQLNVDEVNRLIERLGGTALLPKSADGQDIRLHMPASVEIPLVSAGDGKTAQLFEFETPSLEVAPEIDAEAVRNAVLELPVLPNGLRSKLKGIGDWKSTLPIPYTNGRVRNTELLGREALLWENRDTRCLVWIEGNRVSVLSGNLAVFPDEADILAKGKEILKP